MLLGDKLFFNEKLSSTELEKDVIPKTLSKWENKEWYFSEDDCLALQVKHDRTRLLARGASRRPGTPLEQKMDAFGRPNSGEKGNYFQLIP